MLSQGTAVNVARAANQRQAALTLAELAAIKRAHRTRANRFGAMSRYNWYLSPEQIDAMSVRQESNAVYTYPQLSDGRADPRALRNSIIEMPDAPDVDTTKNDEKVGIYGDLGQVVTGMSPSFRITTSNTASFTDTGGTNIVSAFESDLYAIRVIFGVGSAVLSAPELSTIQLHT